MNPFPAGTLPIDWHGTEMQFKAMLQFLLQGEGILFNGRHGTQLWYTPDSDIYRTMAFGGLRLYEGKEPSQAFAYFMLAESAADKHIDPDDHSDRKLHKWLSMLIQLPGVRELNQDKEVFHGNV